MTGSLFRKMGIGYEKQDVSVRFHIMLKSERIFRQGSKQMTIKRMWLVPLIFCLFVGICAGGENDISRISILGNVKIEEGVIRGAIKSREGGIFSNEQVREDLRSIFSLGYFSDIQVDIKSTPQGQEVIFIVVEKPSIREILITGNQKLKLDAIKEKVTLKPRSILNLEKVKEDSENIRKLYFSKGYYGVNVEYKVDPLATNEVVVRFNITEGPKGSIKKIVFKGNKKIKSSQLKKVMTTKQSNILSILTKTGILDEDILKSDVQLLSAYYMDQGYLDAKISEPKVDLHDPKRIQIEIEIAEGPIYRLGNIDFKGDLLTTKEDLFRTLKIRRNDVYRTSVIRREINTLTEKFANEGYAFAEVSTETPVDSKNLLVHITDGENLAALGPAGRGDLIELGGGDRRLVLPAVTVGDIEEGLVRGHRRTAGGGRLHRRLVALFEEQARSGDVTGAERRTRLVALGGACGRLLGQRRTG